MLTTHDPLAAADQIGAALDDLARTADPADVQIGGLVLAMALALLRGAEGRVLAAQIARHGVDPAAALTLARALASLAGRLGVALRP